MHAFLGTLTAAGIVVGTLGILVLLLGALVVPLADGDLVRPARRGRA